MSVCPSALNNSAPTGRIFMKFDVGVIFENMFEKRQVSLISDKNNGYFTEDQCTFLIIFRSFLLRPRYVSDKCCRENHNTHFVVSNSPTPRKSSRLRYNVETYFTNGQATDDNMAHAHCVLDTKGYKYILRILLFHYNNGCTNAPQCYVILTLSVLLVYSTFLYCVKNFTCK